jgi:5S rRNA maturation endonuclease (ribonuclease M5)
MIGAESIARALGGKRNGSGWMARCPVKGHDDGTPSLSISQKNGVPLVHCHAGCDQGAVIGALKARGLWPDSKSNGHAKATSHGERGVVEAAYAYEDEHGQVIMRVVRFAPTNVSPKTFRQQRPARSGDDPRIVRNGWVSNVQGVRKVVYRLPRVIKAIRENETIVVVEGEKDVGRLEQEGLTATCNVGGASKSDSNPKWTAEHAQYLRGGDVVVIPDCDEPGHKHAQAVARSLHDIAKRVRVVELPGLKEHEDASDWLDKHGNTIEALSELIEQTPEWTPEPETPKPVPSGEAEPQDDRPTIWLIKGEQPRAVDEATALLSDSGEIFERGGELVHVVGHKVEACNDEWLIDFLGRRARFMGFKSVGGTTVEELRDVPPWLPRRINAKAGEQGMQKLCGIATAPTLRQNGSVLGTPGYDSATQLLLIGEAFPEIPDNPSRNELAKAAEDLWYPFKDFPFVDDVSRGVMLAALLTAPIRQTLPMAPAFSFDAPEAGTGKTLLAACIQALVGMDMAVIPECRDEEEVRKRLLSALRNGQPAILFGNIRGTFGSASLEALLTSEHYTDRVLGVSRMISLPTNTMVLFSGNNFRPAGDLWRRILTSRINAETETPELREFDFDPFDFCRNGRQRLIADAVTLLRGFVCAGSPRTTRNRMASFETWDDRVRQAVMWLGGEDVLPISVADPQLSIQAAKDAEPERQRLAGVLTTAHATMRGKRWTTPELVKVAMDAVYAPNVATDQVKALYEHLHEIAGQKDGKIDTRSLGKWISKQVDRWCSGLSLQHDGERSRLALWRIREKEEKA